MSKSLITPIRLKISEELKDRGYRKRFFRRQGQGLAAMYIRGLLKKRNMTQYDLSKKSKLKEWVIYSVCMGTYGFKPLFRIAEALDARLRIIFDPSEDIIQENKDREESERREEFNESF